jgi:hypothetical protein
MSFAAAHESKRVCQTCQSCHDRKARFQYRGVVKADRDHAVCFECYRSEVNRQRAIRLADSPFGRMLSAREAAHRRRMLEHLQLAGA